MGVWQPAKVSPPQDNVSMTHIMGNLKLNTHNTEISLIKL